MVLTEKAKEFNKFRFNGLRYEYNDSETEVAITASDEYDMDFPINNCVIKCASTQVVKAPYGKAFILDCETVVFLKDWQVSENYHGTFVLFNKQYFNPKKWGTYPDFEKGHEHLTFEYFVDVMIKQLDNNTPLIWKL